MHVSPQFIPIIKEVTQDTKDFVTFQMNWIRHDICNTGAFIRWYAFGKPSSNQLECLEQLRTAKKEVTNIVRDSFARREEEQQAKIDALEASAIMTAEKHQAKIIRRIKRAEALMKLHVVTVSGARAMTIRQGVTRLEIPKHPDDDPKHCTEWQLIN